jgi:hypothetical protein
MTRMWALGSQKRSNLPSNYEIWVPAFAGMSGSWMTSFASVSAPRGD